MESTTMKGIATIMNVYEYEGIFDDEPVINGDYAQISKEETLVCTQCGKHTVT